MVLHLDHHVVEDLAPKDYSPQGVVTSSGYHIEIQYKSWKGHLCNYHMHSARKNHCEQTNSLKEI
jgi:hypothetical protein